MKSNIVSVILVVVGLINFVPVLGVASARALHKAYGIEPPTGDLAVLLRHRAVLFGAVGGFIIASAFIPALQVAAVIVAYVALVGFVLLTVMGGPVGERLIRVRDIDLFAIALLSVVPGIWLFGG